jgi:hypothetical protein
LNTGENSTREIDNFYLRQDEPAKSCLLALRALIAQSNRHVTEAWRYGMPFFFIQNKRFCYLWVSKKTHQPYIGIVDGKQIQHPGLVMEKRSRMKVLYVDPEMDIPVQKIKSVLRTVISHYRS